MIKHLTIIVLFVLAACSKDKADDNTMFGATWRVSYFYDGVEKTSDYAGFYFMFNEDGTLMAHQGSKLTIGRWSETNNRFTILFDTNPLLMKFTADWLIIEKTATVIKLKDDLSATHKELHLIRQ
jgi:hypothetical protein